MVVRTESCGACIRDATSEMFCMPSLDSLQEDLYNPLSRDVLECMIIYRNSFYPFLVSFRDG